MKNSITENEIEEVAIGWLQNLGYEYVLGTDISPDGAFPEREYTEVVLAQRLGNAIDRLNPDLSFDAKDAAIKKVLRTESPDALINNETFHKYLTEGVEVDVRKEDGVRGEQVIMVDFENPLKNEFLVVNQFTVVEGNVNKRPFIIKLIND